MAALVLNNIKSSIFPVYHIVTGNYHKKQGGGGFFFKSFNICPYNPPFLNPFLNHLSISIVTRANRPRLNVRKKGNALRPWVDLEVGLDDSGAVRWLQVTSGGGGEYKSLMGEHVLQAAVWSLA